MLCLGRRGSRGGPDPPARRPRRPAEPGHRHRPAQNRLDHLRALHERAGLDRRPLRYQLVGSPADSDRLLSELPAASLVVNATGMGKDRPGSPLSDGSPFPRGGYVWEFNYRGSLEFWHQARAQQEARGLVLEDGWRYFVHGWSQVVADVFELGYAARDGGRTEPSRRRTRSPIQRSTGARRAVRTVTGDVAADQLGPTNYHEHLFQVSPLLPGDELDDEAAQRTGGATRSRQAASPPWSTPRRSGLGRGPGRL